MTEFAYQLRTFDAFVTRFFPFSSCPMLTELPGFPGSVAADGTETTLTFALSLKITGGLRGL
jgi:hypothetical protein